MLGIFLLLATFTQWKILIYKCFWVSVVGSFIVENFFIVWIRHTYASIISNDIYVF